MKWYETDSGKRKIWLNEHGICRDCGQRDVEPNTQLCFECAQRKYKKANEYYQKHKEKIKEQAKERSKKIYEERKENGICVKCGKRKAIKGLTFCIECRAKSKRVKDKRWNNDINRSERPSYGMCYVCGKKITSNEKLCDICLERCRKQMTILNKNPTKKMIEQRTRWKKENQIIFERSKKT